MSAEGSTEVVRYYTRARKFPQLLGKLPDGTKIPGGPYTIYQLLAGVGILLLAANTMGVWGVFGSIGNVIILMTLVWGTIFFLGRMPTSGRNPFSIVAGLWQVIAAPRSGRYQGRPIRLRRPRTVTHRVNVWSAPRPQISQVTIASRAISVTPSGADTWSDLNRRIPGQLPLTGVQSLLANAERQAAKGGVSPR